MGSNFSIQKRPVEIIKSDLAACRHWKDYLALFCAVGGGLGYIPIAPGTWGSLPGLFLGSLVYGGSSYVGGGFKPLYYGIIFGLLVVWAYWALFRVERMLNIHDEGRFVVDEVVGQAIACSLVQPNLITLLSAFVFFRILDILKPGPIGYLDRSVPGAWGTLLDDIVAGMFAGMVILIGFLFGVFS